MGNEETAENQGKGWGSEKTPVPHMAFNYSWSHSVSWHIIIFANNKLSVYNNPSSAS